MSSKSKSRSKSKDDMSVSIKVDVKVDYYRKPKSTYELTERDKEQTEDLIRYFVREWVKPKVENFSTSSDVLTFYLDPDYFKINFLRKEVKYGRRIIGYSLDWSFDTQEEKREFMKKYYNKIVKIVNKPEVSFPKLNYYVGDDKMVVHQNVR